MGSIVDQFVFDLSVLYSTSNVGSVVEFSPATREARVRFPDVASFVLRFKCSVKDSFTVSMEFIQEIN